MTTFVLTDEHKEHFERDGFVVLKGVLSKEFLGQYKEEFRKKVVELNTLTKPMDERTTYEKAFLQVINLWNHSEKIKEFVFNEKLASIATEVSFGMLEFYKILHFLIEAISYFKFLV